MSEKRVSSGVPAGRLLLGAGLAGAIFFGVSALLLTVVWGGAKLFGLDGPVGQGLLNLAATALILVMITATLLTIAERKWSAAIQNRVGPNRARLFKGQRHALFGIPHILADTLKMLSKEDFVPMKGTKLFFNLAPILAFAPAFALVAVLPIGPSVEAFGVKVGLQIADLDMGLLYIFAVASIAIYGTALAGWASNNKFALMGGLRASAQMISYEVTLALTLVGALLLYGTLRPLEIATWQDATFWGLVPRWGIFFQPVAFVFFLVAAAAEIKRAPFDLPEGESEIVGYFVEYSGMKFGLFMIAEFVEVVVLAGLVTVVFFGGWSIPWLPYDALIAQLSAAGLGPDWGGLLAGLLAIFAFVTKMMFFVWLQMMVRWTFPRFRYDQVMDLGWKMLLPLSLANVVLTAALIAWDPTLQWAMAVGLIETFALFIVAASVAAPDREEELARVQRAGGRAA